MMTLVMSQRWLIIMNDDDESINHGSRIMNDECQCSQLAPLQRTDADRYVTGWEMEWILGGWILFVSFTDRNQNKNSEPVGEGLWSVSNKISNGQVSGQLILIALSCFRNGFDHLVAILPGSWQSTWERVYEVYSIIITPTHGSCNFTDHWHCDSQQPA